MPANTYKADQKELPYLELRMRQHEMFWSRIQTGITIHGAGLMGSFLIFKESYWEIAILINISACILSMILIRIVKRDADLMDSLAKNLPTMDFHQKLHPAGNYPGRKWAYCSQWFLSFIEIIMAVAISVVSSPHSAISHIFVFFGFDFHS